MKNSQKGFVVPILLVIIALLAVGGGVYVYEIKKVGVQKVQVSGVVDSSKIQQSNQISQNTVSLDLRTYSDGSISFIYPPFISIKREGETVILSHSTAYKHPNPCDFKGDAPLLEKFSDFTVSLKVVNKNLKELVQSTTYPGWDYVSKNPFKSGSLNGYKVMSGVEGCGEYIYYFTISPTKTLVLNRAIVTEFEPIIGQYRAIMNNPDFISPDRADEEITRLLASFKSI